MLTVYVYREKTEFIAETEKRNFEQVYFRRKSYYYYYLDNFRIEMKKKSINYSINKNMYTTSLKLLHQCFFGLFYCSFVFNILIPTGET